MNNIVCFSENKATVEVAFRDYMNHYLSEVEKREGYIYDKTVNFSEKEAKVNKIINAEVSKLSNVTFTSENASSMSSNPMVKWAYFAVSNSLIDIILPDVLDKSIGLYTEQDYIDYGGSKAYTVEPNDLFYVSKVGRDQRTVEFQKQFAGMTTIIPENRSISVSVNFYKVMCGLESIAKFVMKAILSIEANITKEVYKAFDAAMSDLPTTPVDGNLKVTGWDVDEAIRLAQTVTAFNNGAKSIFMGTQLALRNVLPDGTAYRYMLDSDYVKIGYVKTAFGTDTLVLPQIADWTTPYKLGLKDDRIYVISPSTQKPVKLVYEGSSRTNASTAFENADLTETTTINKAYGIGIATNAIAGLITL